MSSLANAQNDEPDIHLIYCTCPTESVAHAIARVLVGEGLAACVHCLAGGLSIYRWQGQVEEAREHTLLIKAPASRYQALESRIRELHPYELPEIIAIPLSAGLPAYLRWVQEACMGTDLA